MGLLQTLLARLFGIPHLPAVEQHQQLLRSWRTFLYTCRALEHTLTEPPPEVALGIVQARGEITRLKAQLRQWGAEVADLDDELPLGDASAVAHQLGLLTIYRRNLEHYLQQHQHFGDRDVPVHVLNSIADTQRKIGEIKRRLREWQVAVADQPNDTV